MKLKLLSLFFCLILIETVSSRPKSKLLSLGSGEIDSEAKFREKRKLDGPILKQLEDSGLGVKRSLTEEAEVDGGKKVEEAVGKESAKVVDELKAPEVPPSDLEENKSRVKKQSPNNVCIKLGNCGKTACGPIVSARGQMANDMRTLMQVAKPLMTYGSSALDTMTDGASKPFMSIGSAALNAMAEGASKMDQVSPMQARTFDTLMGLAPFTVGSLGYGTPAVYSAAPVTTSVSADTGSYGHSFIKPPVSTVSTIPVAVFAQHTPLMHPSLLSHLMPHLLPHMTSSIGTFLTPHRIQIEPERVPVTVQNDVKQPQPQPQTVPVPVPVPTPVFPPPSYFSSDSTLLCQPYRNQRLDNPFDYIYKPDIAIDKSLNVSDASKKSEDSDSEREKKIQEHLRKVNEIKDEISQLNRAAQRIVDQQERLTQLQQKSLWGSGGSSSSSSSQASASSSGSPLHAGTQMINPYMGAGYYQHPGMPWGYSKSNILSYPNSQDDIDFFINVLRAGKRLGLFSDSFHNSMSNSMSSMVKEPAGNTENSQKETLTDSSAQVTDTKISPQSTKRSIK